MASIIDSVTSALTGAGFKTGPANPGRWISAVTEPVAALSIEKVDTKTSTVTVRATVVSPVELGGEACEMAGLTVSGILKGLGGTCIQKACQYDAKTELFSVPVLAEFQGEVLSGSWNTSEGCQVKLGSGWLDHPVAFTAWRETDTTVTDYTAAEWNFRVEEILEDGAVEVTPGTGFATQVILGNRTDKYTDCTITSQKRTFSGVELRQVWEGTAKAKA